MGDEAGRVLARLYRIAGFSGASTQFLQSQPNFSAAESAAGMSTILSFRDLEVWQVGMNLVVDVYRQTESFPPTERYGLRSQIRRAAVSIPSNVAEGHARRSDGAYLNHVRIALGSQAELGTGLEIASRLGYLSNEVSNMLIARVDEVRRMLHGLRRSLERRRLARPIPHPPSLIPV
jgi:four helix bundle protein